MPEQFRDHVIAASLKQTATAELEGEIEINSAIT